MSERVGKLFIVTLEYDRRPLLFIGELFNLESHERVLSHPLDLLAQRGESVDQPSLEMHMQRNAVGLIVSRTGEACDSRSRDHGIALLLGQFTNHHGLILNRV